MPNEITAYIRGQHAYADGASYLRGNPYDQDDQPDAHESWQEGWYAASEVVIVAG